MKDVKEFQNCATRLKALADPDRLQIVTSLFAGTKHVGELAEELGYGLVNVSHHLGVLRRAKIVKSQKQGRRVLYGLHPEVVVATDQTGASFCIDLGCCRLDLNS